jgi:GxxExxY protein
MNVREPSARANNAARAVVDSALEVHRTIGPGFLESTYREALLVELQLRGVACAAEVAVNVLYKDRVVGQGRADLVVDECLVVELKAIESLLPIHVAQLLSYMRATGNELGLLINFNVERLKSGIRRVVNTSGARLHAP